MTNYDSAIAKIRQLPQPQIEQVNDFLDFLLMKLNQTLTSSQSTRPRPQFGSARGTITIAADFDEPLDEFQEYMA